MIRCLIAGPLYNDPQARTSQAGKLYTTAKLRADGKDGASIWCSLIAFGDLAERLLPLKANAAVAVSGRAELSAYTAKSGDLAASLSLVVDELATLKGKPRPPQGEEQGAPPQRPQRPRATPSPVAAGFDDELPEWT